MKIIIIVILIIIVFQQHCSCVGAMTLSELTTLINARGGNVITRGNLTFNNARFGYNYRYNRIPFIIVQPSDSESIPIILEFAQNNSLQVSVKSGGHSSIAEGVQSNRVTIDLSQMKQISYNTESGVVTTQPGNRWIEFYNFTINQYQVATPGGSCPDVGVSGLTLGGGANDLSTRWGLCTDNLLEAQVVLANGTILIANKTQYSDLFWGLRGGGHGGLGIVTQLKFQAYSIEPQFYKARITWNWTDFEVVLFKVNEFSQTMPNNISLYFSSARVQGSSIPTVALSCFFNGDPSEGEQYCGQFRSFYGVEPISFTVTLKSFYEYISALSNDPPISQSYTKASFLTNITKEVIILLKQNMDASPQSLESDNSATLNLYWQGGLISEKPRNYTSYPHRTYPWNCVWISEYIGEEYQQQYNNWISKAYSKMAPYSQGVYPNYPDDTLVTWAEDYYMENLPALIDVKTKYDPTNYFSFLQSIPISSSSSSNN